MLGFLVSLVFHVFLHRVLRVARFSAQRAVPPPILLQLTPKSVRFGARRVALSPQRCDDTILLKHLTAAAAATASAVNVAAADPIAAASAAASCELAIRPAATLLDRLAVVLAPRRRRRVAAAATDGRVQLVRLLPLDPLRLLGLWEGRTRTRRRVRGTTPRSWPST